MGEPRRCYEIVKNLKFKARLTVFNAHDNKTNTHLTYGNGIVRTTEESNDPQKISFGENWANKQSTLNWRVRIPNI